MSSSTTTTPTKKVTISEQPKVAYTETRAKKKAREVLDLISDKKQRQESVMNLLGKEYTGPNEKQLEMIFRIFDTNRDGKIGAEELAGVLRSMGKRPLAKRINKILNECDENKSGFIEMDEFVRYMQKKAVEKARILGLLQEDDVPDVEGGDTDEEEAPVTNSKKRKSPTKTSKTVKKQPAAATTTTTTTNLAKQPSFFAPVARGTSIVHFYTENAGVHTANNIELDVYNNPAGKEYDLGIEGAFLGKTLLFGVFAPHNFDETFLTDVEGKGFKIVTATTMQEFIDLLPTADVAAVLSSNIASEIDRTGFLAAIRKFHESGKGLYLRSDDMPLMQQCNWVLHEMFNVQLAPSDASVQSEGNLKLGNGTDKLTFASHPITSGITNLFEGYTISYLPRQSVPKKLSVLASSTLGNPIILHSNDALLGDGVGRVVVDTAFIKMMDSPTAGTRRYVKNVFVWLLGVDRKVNQEFNQQAPAIETTNTTNQVANQ
eukprot:gene6913-8038_t